MNKTFKKVVAIVLSIMMILSVFAVAVSAEDTDLYYKQGDYSIHYNVIEAEGTCKGRILFIHGFLYSGSTWNSVAKVMSENGYDCYLADLPGYGLSTRENENTEIIPREELMVGLMTSVAPLDEWILAGHSMGGGVALNIACDHPEIEALMLCCPSEVNMPGKKVLNPLTTSDAFIKVMNTMFKMLLNPVMVKLALLAVTRNFSYAMNYDTTVFTSPLLMDGTAKGMLYSTANARNTDLTAISGIDVPTLLIWADGDMVISQTNVDNITSALSSAEVHEVPGGHLSIETNSQENSSLMVDFLATK